MKLEFCRSQNSATIHSTHEFFFFFFLLNIKYRYISFPIEVNRVTIYPWMKNSFSISKLFILRRRNLKEIHLQSGCFSHGHKQLALEITVTFGNLFQHASQLPILISHSLQFYLECVELANAKYQISNSKTETIKAKRNPTEFIQSEPKSRCNNSPQFLVEYWDYHFPIFGFQYSNSADPIRSVKRHIQISQWIRTFDHYKMQQS